MAAADVPRATVGIEPATVVYRRTGGTVTVAAELPVGLAVTLAARVVGAVVTTVPAVQHAEVRASGSRCGMVVVAMVVIVAVTADVVPGVTAAIAGIEHRAPEVEVVAVRIAGVDAEVPVAAVPVEWAVEIAGGTEGLPLPVKQNIAEVQVATLPVGGVDVVVAGDTHQVVEVDFVGGLILRLSQVQLVSHLVRQEEGFVACLFVAHCMARCCYRQHCYQGYHHLLHCGMNFIVVRHFVNFSRCKIRKKPRHIQRIFPKP